MDPPQRLAATLSSAATKINREHTQAEWESHRETFTRLYMAEDKQLPEVKSIMESEYGFSATDRQYKRRIATWGLEKYIKDADMRVMLRKQVKRRLELGKDSEFELNGRQVKPRRLESYIQRKGIGENHILIEQAKTPPYISCHTPNDRAITVANATMRNREPQAQMQMLPQLQLPDDSASTEEPDERAMVTNAPRSPLPLLAFQSKPRCSATLAARLTHLIWRNPIDMVTKAETCTRIVTNEDVAMTATAQFVKWTSIVLATTHLANEAVLLALLLIYRLKMMNPKVVGRPGSEFRLLTCALILSNKFLDDNFYTNQTWAEVCGIKVNEINVMEIEFMSNMQYSFYCTKLGWAEWRDKIDNFDRYFQRVTKLPTGQTNPDPSLSTYHATSTHTVLPDLQNSIGSQHYQASKDARNIFNPMVTPFSQNDDRPGSTDFEYHEHCTRIPQISKHHASFVAEPATQGVFRLSSDSSRLPHHRHDVNLPEPRFHSSWASPFERICPQYHISSSPAYFRRPITPSNPLSLCSPLPISCNSRAPTPMLMSSFNCQSVEANAPRSDEMEYVDIGDAKGLDHGKTIHKGPLPTVELDLSLEWPVMSDADGMVF